MVAQIDEQQAAVIADAMAPAGKADVGAILGQGQGPAGVGAVAVHDFSVFSLQAEVRRCVTENGQGGKLEVFERQFRDRALVSHSRGTNWRSIYCCRHGK